MIASFSLYLDGHTWLVAGGCCTGQHESRQLVSMNLGFLVRVTEETTAPPCRAAMERERDGLCEHRHVTGDAESVSAR